MPTPGKTLLGALAASGRQGARKIGWSHEACLGSAADAQNWPEPAFICPGKRTCRKHVGGL